MIVVMPRRCFHAFQTLKSPMRFRTFQLGIRHVDSVRPLCALIYPSSQQFDLGIAQWLIAGRRHQAILFETRYQLNQQTLFAVTGENCPATLSSSQRDVLYAQIKPTLLRRSRMALVAVVSQDRLNILLEINWIGSSSDRRRSGTTILPGSVAFLAGCL